MYIHKMYLTGSGVRTMSLEEDEDFAKAMKESLKSTIKQTAAPPDYTHCFRDLAVMRDSSLLVVRKIGLSNLNSRCYANATIQLLRSFTPVHDYFLHKFKTTDIDPNCKESTKQVLLALHRTFLMLQYQLSPEKTKWQLNELIDAAERENDKYKEGDMYTAMEFTKFLISVCNDCLNVSLFKRLGLRIDTIDICSKCTTPIKKTELVNDYTFSLNTTQQSLPQILLHHEKGGDVSKKCDECKEFTQWERTYNINVRSTWFLFSINMPFSVAKQKPVPQKIRIASESFKLYGSDQFKIVSFQMYTKDHYVNVQRIGSDWYLFNDSTFEPTSLEAIDRNKLWFPCEFLCRRV